jgi:hypothetical protein
VWLDEFELTLGDSLRRKIDHGLSRSRYGLVVLSPSFFRKEWPNKELDGLVAREDGREKVVLPIWHNVSAADVVKYSPMLAGKMGVSTSHGLQHVAERVRDAVRQESVVGENVRTQISEGEADLLGRLRKQMLLSRSAGDLRAQLYELEAHMATYPHSPEARLLKDAMQAAIRHAEDVERPRAQAQLPSERNTLRWIVVLGTLGAVVYVLLRILGVL